MGQIEDTVTLVNLQKSPPKAGAVYLEWDEPTTDRDLLWHYFDGVPEKVHAAWMADRTIDPTEWTIFQWFAVKFKCEMVMQKAKKSNSRFRAVMIGYRFESPEALTAFLVQWWT